MIKFDIQIIIFLNIKLIMNIISSIFILVSSFYFSAMCMERPVTKIFERGTESVTAEFSNKSFAENNCYLENMKIVLKGNPKTAACFHDVFLPKGVLTDHDKTQKSDLESLCALLNNNIESLPADEIIRAVSYGPKGFVDEHFHEREEIFNVLAGDCVVTLFKSSDSSDSLNDEKPLTIDLLLCM